MLEFISDIGAIETKAGDVLLKKKSPLFSSDSIEGELTFPFTIPMTDELRSWLNHPERPEAVNQTPIKTIQVKRNGMPILIGDLIIGDADEESVETTLISGSSPFASLIKDVYLDELNLGSHSFSSEEEMNAYFNSSIQGNYTTHPYYLPTVSLNPQYNMNYYNETIPGYVLKDGSDRLRIMPMLYYPWILNKVFEIFGYEFEDRVFKENADLREMIFVSLFDINNQTDPLTFSLSSLLPNYKLSTWLIDIQNALGVKFIFYNNKNKVVLDWLTSSLTNASKSKIVLHNKVKVKTGESYISSYRYNLIDAIGNWTSVPNNFLASVWDRKDLPNPAEHPNSYCYVANEDKLYKLYFDAIDQKYTVKVVIPEDVTGFGIGGQYGTFLTNIQLGNSEGESFTFSSNLYPLPTSLPAYLPNIYIYKEEDHKNLTPFILFARHSFYGSGDYPWVFASFVSDNFSFTWPQNSWLFQNKILPWWEFLKNTKKIETTILLSDVNLANWDWTIPVQIGNTKVLVDEMEIPLSSEEELMQVKIIGYTL